MQDLFKAHFGTKESNCGMLFTVSCRFVVVASKYIGTLSAKFYLFM